MTTISAEKPLIANSMKADPSSDVYRSESHPLDSLFLPKSVAVIGASERAGSVGRSVLWNLLSSPFRRHRLSCQSETSRMYWASKPIPALQNYLKRWISSWSPRRRIASRTSLPNRWALAFPVPDRDLGWLQRSRRTRQGVGAADRSRRFAARCGSSVPIAWA